MCYQCGRRLEALFAFNGDSLENICRDRGFDDSDASPNVNHDDRGASPTLERFPPDLPNGSKNTGESVRRTLRLYFVT
jgi:hypothetical protein